VQNALPGQLQPLETVEMIHLNGGQASLWFGSDFRSVRLLRFDGLALPTTGHAVRLYAKAAKQYRCRLPRTCAIGVFPELFHELAQSIQKPVDFQLLNFSLHNPRHNRMDVPLW